MCIFELLLVKSIPVIVFTDSPDCGSFVNNFGFMDECENCFIRHVASIDRLVSSLR